MWRTSVSAEHVRLFFATDAALRPARSDMHAPVRARLAELRAAMDGTPGASSAAAATLTEACAEAGVLPTPLASLPGQSQSRPNEQGAQVPTAAPAPLRPHAAPARCTCQPHALLVGTRHTPMAHRHGHTCPRCAGGGAGALDRSCLPGRDARVEP